MSLRRNWRGRFIKRLRETPEGSREWLIWSHYHSCWHRRSKEGGACGYTSDIAEAGLFDRSMAVAYHDGDRDEPYHLSEVREKVLKAIAEHDRKITHLRSAIITLGEAK